MMNTKKREEMIFYAPTIYLIDFQILFNKKIKALLLGSNINAFRL